MRRRIVRFTINVCKAYTCTLSDTAGDLPLRKPHPTTLSASVSATVQVACDRSCLVVNSKIVSPTITVNVGKVYLVSRSSCGMLLKNSSMAESAPLPTYAGRDGV